jgi:protein ImuB
MLWVALHFPLLPRRTLETIAAWACQFTPKVSLEPPQALLLEVEGSLRLFGGLETLKKAVRSGLEEMGMSAALATAPTARAALWLARSSKPNLEAIPVEAVCDGEALAFLQGIGMHTVGELLRLPREGLAHRCGERLVDELDRALGSAPEPRLFF